MIFDFLTDNLQESFLIPLIGLLLSTFLHKTTSYLVEDPELRKAGRGMYWTGKETEQQKAARLVREEQKKIEDRKVFTYSMFSGVIALVLGIWTFLQSDADPRVSAPGRGIALGGFLLVLYNTLMRWNDFQELVRIAVLGLSFISLAGAAFYMA